MSTLITRNDFRTGVASIEAGRDWTFGAELFWWAAGLISFPFYLLDKGSMQLSSVFFLFAATASYYRFYR